MSWAVWTVPCGLALSTAVGLVLITALGPDLLRTESLPVRLALGWGAGTILTAAAIFGLGVAGLPLGVGSVAAVLVVLGAVSVAGIRTRARSGADPASDRSGDGQDGRESGGRARWIVLAAVLGVVAVTAVLSIRCRAFFPDAHGVWLLKARVVYVDGGFDGAYWHQWNDAHDRRGYPPLVSLAGTWVHLLAGRVDDGAVKLVFVAFHGALLVLLHAALARRVTRRDAMLATLLFALSGQTIVLAVWGVADLPLAFFVLAAVHAFSRRVPGANAVGGVLLAGAAITKLEGIPAAVIVALSAPLLVPAGRRVGAVVQRLGPMVLAAGVWLLFLYGRGIPILLGPKAGVPLDLPMMTARLGTVVRALADQALSPVWLFVWPLFVLAALRRGRDERRQDRRLWGRIVLALSVLYLCMFVIQSVDTEWLVATTMDRLMYHAFPLAFLFTVTALAAPAASTRAAGGSA